jgi:SAM-dependent methyltransferase
LTSYFNPKYHHPTYRLLLPLKIKIKMASQEESATFGANMWKNPQMGKIYQSVERVTGPFAQALVEQSGVITTTSSSSEKKINILDQGCGTGVIAAALHRSCPAGGAAAEAKNWHLTCTDVSAPMLAAMQERIEANGWESNTETAVSDILKNRLESERFDFLFASFG